MGAMSLEAYVIAPRDSVRCVVQHPVVKHAMEAPPCGLSEERGEKFDNIDEVHTYRARPLCARLPNRHLSR
eukprot:scaffold248993_cov35-Tisochrysis_lutea.AAC.1